MAVYRRGCIYYIDYYFEGQRIREKVGPNHTEAKQALKARLGEIAQGRFNLTSISKAATFESLFSEYMVFCEKRIQLPHGKNLKPRTLIRYRISAKIIQDFFRRTFDNIRIDKIRKFHIEAFKEKRLEIVSGATINRDLALLQGFFTWALQEGYTKQSPFVSERIDYFKEIIETEQISELRDGQLKRRPRFLSEEQASALLSACDSEPMGLFVLLGLHCGMRHEELLKLKWEDVNLNDHLILVRNPKNGEDDYIAMTQDIFETLSTASRIGETVICRLDGKPYVNIRKKWNALLSKANLPCCTPHIMRHTYATTLARAGVSTFALQKLGRWLSRDMVDRYAHFGPEDAKREIRALDGKFKNVVTNWSQGTKKALKVKAIR